MAVQETHLNVPPQLNRKVRADGGGNRVEEDGKSCVCVFGGWGGGSGGGLLIGVGGLWNFI